MNQLVKVFFALLMTTTTATAELIILKENRIQNVPPGYCSWCSIEMIGRERKIKPLIGLVEARKGDGDIIVKQGGVWYKYGNNVGHETAIEAKLKKLGVKYQMQWTGNFDIKMIEYAIKKNLGCVIAVKAGTLDKYMPHAVVLTKFNSKSIEMVDPNYINANYIGTREWFNQAWNGFVLVIEE